MLKRYFLTNPDPQSVNYYQNDDSDESDESNELAAEIICAAAVYAVLNQRPTTIMAVVSDKPLRRPAHYILAGAGGITDLKDPVVAYHYSKLHNPFSFFPSLSVLNSVKERLKADFNGTLPLYVRFVPIVK